MKRLEARAEQLGRAKVRRKIEEIAASWREAAPDISVEVDSSSVTLRGTAMLRSWLTEPRLRFAGRMAR